MAQKLNEEEARRIAELDDVRATHFFRAPDRPDSRFVKSSRRVPIEVRRAQARMRTARWRSELDRRKAPTTRDVGMAMVIALSTMEHVGRLTEEDVNIVRRAFAYLEANGFAVEEAKALIRRMRLRLVDPADREGEESETRGPPIRPDLWGPALF